MNFPSTSDSRANNPRCVSISASVTGSEVPKIVTSADEMIPQILARAPTDRLSHTGCRGRPPVRLLTRIRHLGSCTSLLHDSRVRHLFNTKASRLFRRHYTQKKQQAKEIKTPGRRESATEVQVLSPAQPPRRPDSQKGRGRARRVEVLAAISDLACEQHAGTFNGSPSTTSGILRNSNT